MTLIFWVQIATLLGQITLLFYAQDSLCKNHHHHHHHVTIIIISTLQVSCEGQVLVLVKQWQTQNKALGLSVSDAQEEVVLCTHGWKQRTPKLSALNDKSLLSPFLWARTLGAVWLGVLTEGLLHGCGQLCSHLQALLGLCAVSLQSVGKRLQFPVTWKPPIGN